MSGELLDVNSGAPFQPRGDATTGAALVEIVGSPPGSPTVVAGKDAKTAAIPANPVPVEVETLPATPPGENHIGAVGGAVVAIQVQTGPAAAANYTSGQVIGSVQELAGAGRVAAGSGMMTTIRAALKAVNTVQVDVIIFNRQPAGSYTDGQAVNVPAADIALISKVYHLTDWTALGSYSMGQAPAEPIFFRCQDPAKTQSLWVLFVARGAISLSSPTDLTATLNVSQN